MNIETTLTLLHLFLLNLSCVGMAGEWYTTYRNKGVVGDCVIYPQGSFGLFETVCGVIPSNFIEIFPSKSDPLLCSLDTVKALISANYGINAFGIITWLINPHKTHWHIVILIGSLVLLITSIITFFNAMADSTLEYSFGFYSSLVTSLVSLFTLGVHARRSIFHN